MFHLRADDGPILVLFGIGEHYFSAIKKQKQEMSQSRGECPQRNWSSIRHIRGKLAVIKEICSRHENIEMRPEVNVKVKITQKGMPNSAIPRGINTPNLEFLHPII